MAKQILDRGFERVGCRSPMEFSPEHIQCLTLKVAQIDPKQMALAHKIEQICLEAFA